MMASHWNKCSKLFLKIDEKRTARQLFHRAYQLDPCLKYLGHIFFPKTVQWLKVLLINMKK